jgi:hypothetical protein
MKRFAIIAALLAASIAQAGQPGNLSIFSGIHYGGREWKSDIQRCDSDGRCAASYELIPAESYWHQFSIRAAPGLVCQVMDADNRRYCVDDGGWWNIEAWGNLVSAQCYDAQDAYCGVREIVKKCS